MIILKELIQECHWVISLNCFSVEKTKSMKKFYLVYIEMGELLTNIGFLTKL